MEHKIFAKSLMPGDKLLPNGFLTVPTEGITVLDVEIMQDGKHEFAIIKVSYGTLWCGSMSRLVVDY